MIYLYTTIDENLSSFDDIIDILRKELGSDFQITFYTENKRCFRAFNNIKAISNTNDIIVIGKFEDIGLNDLAVKESIKYFLEKSVMLIVRDTPSTYECGISPSVNIAVYTILYQTVIKKLLQSVLLGALAPVVLNWIFQKIGKSCMQNGNRKKSHQANL